ncbi:DUF2934 domain-containing protein [Prosthecobacter sp.]|uniref:DUF2934 domain-containing protein n=1 Tax=Prosthecobacter sp. TaxID=1965333 RepID=UPI003782D345
MNSIPTHRTEHRYEEISLLAYHLWQKAQCPPGEDLKFWLQAEQQLFGKREPQSAAGKKAPTQTLAKTPGNGKAATKRLTTTTTTTAGKTQARTAAKTGTQQQQARAR